jgi:molybdopterin-binding protein
MDFGALFQQFDTLLVGRGTFEFMVEHGQATVPGMKIIVFSRKLQQCDFPDVTIVAGKEKETVAALREKPGKDIWLFGGGLLFRSFLELGLVDTAEIAVIPVLLGGGIPLLPAPAKKSRLNLTGHKVYGGGIVLLEYSKEHAGGAIPNLGRPAKNDGARDLVLDRFVRARYHPGMRISARNRLIGKIEELQIGDLMAHVVVSVGEHLVESVISRRSVEEMNLQVGDTVAVVVQSTDVMLQKA